MSDEKRLASLQRFIVYCLAKKKDSGDRELDQKDRLSENRIGKLLADGNGRSGRSRLVGFMRASKRTTGEVVDLLSRLRVGIQSEYFTGRETPVLWPLTTEQVYLALQKLIMLTPEEKKSLGLACDDNERLFQQIILNLHVYQKPWTQEKLLSFYRLSTRFDLVSEDRTFTDDENFINDWIKTAIQEYEQSYMGLAPLSDQQDLNWEPAEQLEIASKVHREINRILLKTGAGQINLGKLNGKATYKKRYFSKGYVQRLTQSVFDNQMLTQLIPVFLQDISIETCGPFPLERAENFEDSGKIAQPLLKLDKTHPEDAEIAAHSANRVTLKFYLKLNKKVDCLDTSISGCRLDHISAGYKLSFNVTSTGVGGTLSHLNKILNYALFYDVQCLRPYFPIARDIVFEQKVVQHNSPSPVAAHSLVALCRTKSLADAMLQSCKEERLCSYEEFAFDDPVGRGDYCAFDTLMSTAQSALQARLRAIKRTTELPQKYVRDLCERIHYSCVVKEAKSHIKGYPFSSLVQESFLLEQLTSRNFPKELERSDSYLLFDACLSLAETFLREGAHSKAESYLKCVDRTLQELSDSGVEWYSRFSSRSNEISEFNVFSWTLVIRYEICLATVSYLRHNTEKSWEHLNRADKHLTLRLSQYTLIGEVSQATFHPHYGLRAYIYFLRARLMLFFPCEVPKVESEEDPFYLPTDRYRDGKRLSDSIHSSRLYLMEKARLYAACNGDSELYTCFTAYQASIYLLASVTHSSSVVRLSRDESDDFELSQEHALKWAKRLRDEALLSYSDLGRRCYYQIKEKSGVSEELLPKFGSCRVSPVPIIEEILVHPDEENTVEPGLSSLQEKNKSAAHVLRLDMKMLALDENLVKDQKHERGTPIYLFGSNACYLFFIRGLYYLCTDYSDEFSEDKTANSSLDWDVKLRHAYRLFSYAWAIAADGGEIVSEAYKENEEICINRDFQVPLNVHFERDVASIQDLYPHRVADIAALGRLFAAACAALRLHTSSGNLQKRKEANSICDWLLDDLYQVEECKKPEMKKILNGQEKFNDHLERFLDDGKRAIKRVIKIGNAKPRPNKIKSIRNRLVEQILKSPLEDIS